jgi:hypothetical protein
MFPSIAANEEIKKVKDVDSIWTTMLRPANEILIPILVDILTAPKADFGFGITTGSIDPQGSRTSRKYLDYLIGLAPGQSPRGPGLRYRLNLERPDGDMSSEVQENISTDT